jgi:hypothetical protein
MSVSFETTNPETSSSESPETPQLQKSPSSSVFQETAVSANISSSTTTPGNQVERSSSKATSLTASSQNSTKITKGQGTLRMSNQTNQPVRLALLARQSKLKGSDSVQTHHDIPAHWDFAPQEGSEQGLLLSLPNGNLKLEKGDILVAFAQDGSRRYWGPYVVGETSKPSWNAKSREWQLVLQQ